MEHQFNIKLTQNVVLISAVQQSKTNPIKKSYRISPSGCSNHSSGICHTQEKMCALLQNQSQMSDLL